MTVDLQYYLVEESTGIKTKIDNILDLDSIFKGTEQRIPIAVYNNGNETAVTPKVFFTEYLQEGSNFYEALTWKKLAEDKYDEFKTILYLPDIQPKSWLAGKQIFYENFDTMPKDRTPLDKESWWIDEGLEGTWRTYSGYIEHNEDTQPGRCFWKTLPTTAKDYSFSTRITVRNNSWAGYILRHNGDYDTGYIVLVQGLSRYFTSNMSIFDGVIQVWNGKFSNLPDNYKALGKNLEDYWTLLATSPSIGLRGTHDFFKVKVNSFTENGTEKCRLDFWFQNELSETPFWSWIDNNGTYNKPGVPILCADTSANDDLIYFDDMKMEIPTSDGRIWISDNVKKETPVFGRQFSVFRVEYGGV